MSFQEKKLTVYVITFLLILYTNISFALNTQPSPQLQKWIKSQMKQYNIPGASIAVIKNYKIEWAMGFGLKDKANKDNVTINTLFQAASISKPVTALAVMKTVKEKNISLDQDINTILTSWKIPPNPYTKNHPVTMRLLLSHSAGITGFRYKGYKLDSQLPNLSEELNGISPANTPPIIVVRQPGAQYEYSPAGYTIIQQALIDIHKTPFDKIMRQLILQPLNMDNSTFSEPLPKEDLSKIAMPYLPNGDPLPNGPYTYIAAAAGGLWTTPTDLAHFVIAIQKALAGYTQNNISPAIVKEMLKSGISHNMGLGFQVNVDKYGKNSHTKADYFLHGGFNSGYLAIMLGSLDHGNGIVVMVNSAPQNMSTSNVKQWVFLTNVVKQIADIENWPS